MDDRRRRLIEHLGGFERVMRYAVQDLDEETYDEFLQRVFASLADLAADRLDEAWRREA